MYTGKRRVLLCFVVKKLDVAEAMSLHLLGREEITIFVVESIGLRLLGLFVVAFSFAPRMTMRK